VLCGRSGTSAAAKSDFDQSILNTAPLDRDGGVCTKSVSELRQTSLKIGALASPKPVTVNLIAAHLLAFNVKDAWLCWFAFGHGSMVARIEGRIC